jgi:hypothetical protein
MNTIGTISTHSRTKITEFCSSCNKTKTAIQWYQDPTDPTQQCCQICYNKAKPLIENTCSSCHKNKSCQNWYLDPTDRTKKRCISCYNKAKSLIKNTCSSCHENKSYKKWYRDPSDFTKNCCRPCYDKKRITLIQNQNFTPSKKIKINDNNNEFREKKTGQFDHHESLLEPVFSKFSNDKWGIIENFEDPNMTKIFTDNIINEALIVLPNITSGHVLNDAELKEIDEIELFNDYIDPF